MDSFISRKRPRLSPAADFSTHNAVARNGSEDEDSTDLKLTILASLHTEVTQDVLLDVLLSCHGSVEDALRVLSLREVSEKAPVYKRSSSIGTQVALSFTPNAQSIGSLKKPKYLNKKGKTLHLYTPADIANHTPCSIIHNFLPAELANDLLRELLPETETFESITFKLFDNVVKSPHTACFYVDKLGQKDSPDSEYFYNGSSLDDVRQTPPIMRKVGDRVRDAVNQEILTRIKDHYPQGQKLKYQTPKKWQPNAAFVNCYDGGTQSVGWHADQLTNVGPRAVIGSLSLGVSREFRVRKTVATDDGGKAEAAESSGQIAIHLPHNSLLVMHAEMQEEWKHSVAPAQAIDPHPISKNKRINITYRWYREEFKPESIPRCKCNIPTVLKSVQRQTQNRGRYMWMCQTSGRPGAGDGCGHFEWAEFTDDGDPVWKHQSRKSVISRPGVSRKPDGLVAESQIEPR